MVQRVLLAAVILAVCGLAFADHHEEGNMATMKRFYEEVVNKGNLDLIDELIAADFVEHESTPGMEPTREGVKQFFKMMRAAFPDLNFNIEFMMADDNKVAAYLTITGTHTGGEFMGMPATNKKINVKGIDIVEFKDGKAVAHWGVTDTMTMMQQLGAMSEPASEK